MDKCLHENRVGKARMKAIAKKRMKETRESFAGRESARLTLVKRKYKLISRVSEQS
jgi:hypothetical protein